MRKFAFWLILTLLMGIMLGLTTGLALAELAPYRPGDQLFPFQQQAEQVMVILAPNAVARAQTLLDLFDRRSIDLERAAAEPQTLGPFDAAYVATLQALAAAPAQDSSELRTRALVVYSRTRETLQRVAGSHSNKTAVLLERWTKIDTSIQILSDLGRPLSDLLPTSPSVQPAAPDPISGDAGPNQATPAAAVVAVDPHMVGFQAGSGGAQHTFFPLTGKHAALACTDCHTGGTYAGTPTSCAACHAVSSPANHFPGECSLCHTPDGWKPAHFSHTADLAGDCITCHQSAKPAGHYDGQCALCHSTDAWKPAHFDHAAVDTSNCAACHQSNLPANHFPGQCALCHSTNTWKPAHFNHASSAAANCQSCHAGSKPANHYSGQCALCHSTNAWKPATFNHAAVKATDCQSCHAGSKPANHYSGQCALCHSTNAWKPATFNHAAAGATDCQSCHAGSKPANHYSGQCALCHSTSAWKPATFNHAAVGATDCQSCHAGSKPANHYSGQCALCHSTNAWKPAAFNHAAVGATDCQSCHAATRPANHYSGQCSQCHTTTAWKPATFNHTFPMTHGGANGRCAACHDDNGSGAPDCFLCHNKAQLDQRHTGIANYATRCLTCHPGGKGN